MSTEPTFLVLLGLAGLAAGSFLNVVIVRVPAHESVVRPGSRCTQCKQPIAWRDNIPVMSWLLLRGRCRSCHEPIPAGYPLVELANAALWVAGALRFGPHLVLVPYLALFSVLLALSVIDLELYILPNRIIYPSVLASVVAIPLVALVVGHPRSIVYAFVGGLGYFLFLFIPALIYPRGMGLGDVKLAGLMGLYLGWLHPVLALISLVLASLIGIVAGMVVLVARRGKSRPYPFGPWLAMGCVAAILFSRPLLSRYGM